MIFLLFFSSFYFYFWNSFVIFVIGQYRMNRYRNISRQPRCLCLQLSTMILWSKEKKLFEGHCHRQWEILKFLNKIICILEFSNFMVFLMLSFCSSQHFFYKRKIHLSEISSGLIVTCSSMSLISTYVLIV